MGAGRLERRYELRLTPQDGVVRAALHRQGPSNPLQIGIGRTPEEGVQLTRLLFALCPRAHGIAFLRAVEQAADVVLAPGQKAGRDTLLLAEAISSAVWRGAVTWPTLLGDVAKPDLVKRSRALSEELPRRVFDGVWAQPGGGHLQPDTRFLKEAHTEFVAITDLLQEAIRSVINQADQVLLSEDLGPAQSLGTAIFDADVTPDDRPREETPRSCGGEARADRSLASWFDAQSRYLDVLIRDYEQAVAQITPDDPVTVPKQMYGVGLGVATTARGRLRHVVSLQEGRINQWSATAPTDWNFAHNGPVIQVASRLKATDDLKPQARWLIAAFDPCAPCDLVVEGRHA